MRKICPSCVSLLGQPLLAILACACLTLDVSGVPLLLNYQGRILAGSAQFDGTGQFKFALVDATGASVYWLNSPDANGDREPDAAIQAPVSRGLHSILIGDTRIANMAPLTGDIFARNALYLRVWFSDGTSAFERLTPDQQLAAVSFAIRAETAESANAVQAAGVVGTLSAAQVPSLDASKITSGTFSALRIPLLDAAKISSGTLDGARLPANVALKVPDLQNATAALNAQIAALTDRLTQLANELQVVSNRVSGIPASLTAVSTEAEDPALTSKGLGMFMSVPPAPWQNGAASGGIAGRTGHTAVWTGEQMMIWGGMLNGNSFAGTGAGYLPGFDGWRPITTFAAPSARSGHGAVWTGAKMIVWGGEGANGFVNSGGEYDALTQQWSVTGVSGAASARADFACLWTGNHVVVWGGNSDAGFLGSGNLYNPGTKAWMALPGTLAPTARRLPGAVWTGTQFVVWGGEGLTGPIGTGGRISISAGGIPGTWQTVSLTGAPAARVGHTAIWTGAKMIIWGGRAGPGYFGSGAAYDPISDSWTTLAMQAAPSPRENHVAVWNGVEMLIVGGEDSTGSLATGGAYDPVANKWRPLTMAGSPIARSEAKAIWSGSELVAFGGRANGQMIGSLQRLNPQPGWHFYRKL